MPCTTNFIRRIEKYSTVPGALPTVGPSNCHTDGTWTDLDIYPGELWFNMADQTAWSSDGTNVFQIGGGSSVTGEAIETIVQNNTGATITAGTPVSFTGHDGTYPEVTVSQSGAGGNFLMPSSGCVKADILDGNFGVMVLFGLVEDLDTSAWVEGTELYVKTDGGLDAVGDTNALQKIGVVTRQDALLGQVEVQGPYRVHFEEGSLDSLPDLTQSHLWIGDNLNRPEEQTLSEILDQEFGSDHGAIIHRDATGWTILTPGTDGEVLTTGGIAADVSWQISPNQDDHTVLADASITDVPEFLEDKLVQGTNVTLTTIDKGSGVKAIQIDFAGSGSTDELVGVTAADTTPGYLDDKITVTGPILNKGVTNPGGDERLNLEVIGVVGGTGGMFLHCDYNPAGANKLDDIKFPSTEFIPWDNQIRVDVDFDVVALSGNKEILFNEAGIYLIWVDAFIDASPGNDFVEIAIETDIGGGFNETDRSRRYGSADTSTGKKPKIELFSVVEVGIGDKLRIPVIAGPGMTDVPLEGARIVMARINQSSGAAGGSVIVVLNLPDPADYNEGDIAILDSGYLYELQGGAWVFQYDIHNRRRPACGFQFESLTAYSEVPGTIVFFGTSDDMDHPTTQNIFIHKEDTWGNDMSAAGNNFFGAIEVGSTVCITFDGDADNNQHWGMYEVGAGLFYADPVLSLPLTTLWGSNTTITAGLHGEITFSIRAFGETGFERITDVNDGWRLVGETKTTALGVNALDGTTGVSGFPYGGYGASGPRSVAFQGGTASGDRAFACGSNTLAGGDLSFAFGNGARTGRVDDSNVPWLYTGSGNNSVAMGFNAWADAGVCTAIGTDVIAQSNYAFVTGFLNTSAWSADGIVRGNAQFIAGIGHNLSTVFAYDTIVPGSGYTDGSYLNVPVISTNGIGSTADVTVLGGQVTAVAVNLPGTNYPNNEVVTFDDNDLGGGGGTGASARVDSNYAFHAAVMGSFSQGAIGLNARKLIFAVGRGATAAARANVIEGFETEGEVRLPGHSLIDLGDLVDADAICLSHLNDAIAAVPNGGDMELAATQTVTGPKTFEEGTLLLENTAQTFTGEFVNTNTADRTYTLPDVSCELACSEYAPFIKNDTPETVTFTATIGETHLIDTSGGAFTCNLPAVASEDGRIAFYFTNTGQSLSIIPDGAETIDGLGGIKIFRGHTTIENNGTEWFVVQRASKNPTRLDPAQITSNQDGYNPTDWDNSITNLYIDSDASREIQGFDDTGFVDMDEVRVTNDGSFDIVIKNETATTVGHRVIVDGGADFTLGPDKTGHLLRDQTANRWRFHAMYDPNTGGGGSDTTAVHVDTANEISGITSAALALDDEGIFEDIDDANNKKRFLFSLGGNATSDSGKSVVYGAEGNLTADAIGAENAITANAVSTADSIVSTSTDGIAVKGTASGTTAKGAEFEGTGVGVSGEGTAAASTGVEAIGGDFTDSVPLVATSNDSTNAADIAEFQDDTSTALTVENNGTLNWRDQLAIDDTRTNLDIPFDLYSTAVNPIASDDNTSGYSVGSMWHNTTTDEAYICMDAGTGVAVWKSVTDAASGATDADAIHVNEAQEIEPISLINLVTGDVGVAEDASDGPWNKKSFEFSTGGNGTADAGRSVIFGLAGELTTFSSTPATPAFLATTSNAAVAIQAAASGDTVLVVESTDGTNTENIAEFQDNFSTAFTIENDGTLDWRDQAAKNATRTNLDIPLDLYSSAVDPVVGDDNLDGYSVGSMWHNTTSDEAFICMDASTGAAVWTSVTAGAASLDPNAIHDNQSNEISALTLIELNENDVAIFEDSSSSFAKRKFEFSRGGNFTDVGKSVVYGTDGSLWCGSNSATVPALRANCFDAANGITCASVDGFGISCTSSNFQGAFISGSTIGLNAIATGATGIGAIIQNGDNNGSLPLKVQSVNFANVARLAEFHNISGLQFWVEPDGSLDWTSDATKTATRDNLKIPKVVTLHVYDHNVDADTLTVSNPQFVVPAEYNGLDVVNVTAAVYTLGSTTGAETLDVQLRRKRGASIVDVLSTPVTLEDSEYFVEDGVINGATNDMDAGDILFIEVTNGFLTTDAQGLTVTVTLQLP